MFYFDNKTFKFEPIENYEMKYFGGGKLVALQHKDPDVRLFNRSSLWGKYSLDDNVRVRFYRIYLYMPQGKDTFEIW